MHTILDGTTGQRRWSSFQAREEPTRLPPSHGARSYTAADSPSRRANSNVRGSVAPLRSATLTYPASTLGGGGGGGGGLVTVAVPVETVAVGGSLVG